MTAFALVNVNLVASSLLLGLVAWLTYKSKRLQRQTRALHERAAMMLQALHELDPDAEAREVQLRDLQLRVEQLREALHYAEDDKKALLAEREQLRAEIARLKG